MPSHYNPDELSKLHKTLSKSFGLQRKTLIRVLGLEGRVSKLEGEEESVATGVNLRHEGYLQISYSLIKRKKNLLMRGSFFNGIRTLIKLKLVLVL